MMGSIFWSIRSPVKVLGVLPGLPAIIAGLCLLGSIGAVHGQSDWPTKPVRVILPASPGGASDMIARLLTEQLAKNLKQPFVVDNKPGASGVISVNALLGSKADGYTWWLGPNSTWTEAPQVMQVPFDPLKDGVQVANLVQYPLLLVANPAVPAQTLEELIAYAKANTGKLSVASYGAGTRAHYAVAIFNHDAGIDLQHVPYKSSPPVVNDLLGGQIPLAFELMPNVIKYIQAGKLKAFAILSPQRSTLLPDVPTMAEKRFTNVGLLPGWLGVWVSAKTPEALANRIHAEIVQAFTAPKIKQFIDSGVGYEFSTDMSIQEQNRALKESFERSAMTVKKFNIKQE
jgi:tripartite-type tricarboxylate transporter receptor subunit TctC